jgi:hypothetical protein
MNVPKGVSISMEGASRTLLGSFHAGRVSTESQRSRVREGEVKETKVRKNNRVGGAGD